MTENFPLFNELADLARAVSACRRCRLSRSRTRAVPGEGSPSASVMFIGEGPGYHEDQQGRPFVGAAGQLLDELIEGIGMQRRDVFIANVLKCRPPDNRDPQPDEAAACRPYLNRQIELVDPKIVVLLGRHALQAHFPDAQISKARGVPRYIDGRTFLPVYHPAAALRQTRLRDTLRTDFALLPMLLEGSEVPSPPKPEAEQLSMFG